MEYHRVSGYPMRSHFRILMFAACIVAACAEIASAQTPAPATPAQTTPATTPAQTAPATTPVPRPAIAAISPAAPLIAPNQAVVLTGSNFQKDLIVTFTDPEGYTYPGAVQSVPDSGQAVVIGTLGIGGTWKVTAKNPDGPASDPKEFAVANSTPLSYASPGLYAFLLSALVATGLIVGLLWFVLVDLGAAQNTGKWSFGDALSEESVYRPEGDHEKKRRHHFRQHQSSDCPPRSDRYFGRRCGCRLFHNVEPLHLWNCARSQRGTLIPSRRGDPLRAVSGEPDQRDLCTGGKETIGCRSGGSHGRRYSACFTVDRACGPIASCNRHGLHVGRESDVHGPRGKRCFRFRRRRNGSRARPHILQRGPEYRGLLEGGNRQSVGPLVGCIYLYRARSADNHGDESLGSGSQCDGADSDIERHGLHVGSDGSAHLIGGRGGGDDRAGFSHRNKRRHQSDSRCRRQLASGCY